MKAETVMAVGVARSRLNPSLTVLFQAIRGRRAGPFPEYYLVYPCPGVMTYLHLGPEEFRTRYVRIKEYKSEDIQWKMK